MKAQPMNNVSFAEINALIEEYRDRCLWFLAPRYTPTTPDEAMRTLNLIERYGDRTAYRRAERLKQWLQHHFRAES